MPQFHIPLRSGQIHCAVFGRGAQVLLALHGFGYSGAIFRVLESSLGTRYTIIAPDLPFHGNTVWEGDRYDPEDLQELVVAVLEKTGRDRLQVLGYSLGGRLVLASLLSLNDLVEKVYLVAPDGLGTRWMSVPDLLPSWSRRKLSGLLHNPTWLLRITASLRKARLIDPFIQRYLSYHLRDPKRRHRLLATWVSAAGFQVSKKDFNRARAQNGTMPLTFILGSKDPLVSEAKVRSWLNGTPNTKIQVLPKGHLLIDEELAEWILFND